MELECLGLLHLGMTVCCWGLYVGQISLQSCHSGLDLAGELVCCRMWMHVC